MPSGSTSTPPDARPRGRRRFGFARVGLQLRLVVWFVALIGAALGGSCSLFADQTGRQLDDLLGQQAKLVAYTLSRAAEPAMAGNHRRQLEQTGRELLGSRNVLYVRFLGRDGRPMATACRYADFAWGDVAPVDPKACAAYLVRPPTDRSFGDYVNAYAPVMVGGQGEAIGYVMVGVSLDRERDQLRCVTMLVIAVAAAVTLVSMPVAWGVVYGAFKPVRQLVEATRRMAAGQADFEVPTDRGDAIGVLAQSFADMAGKVRRQREDLAQTNLKLAEANGQLARANGLLGDANGQLAEANRDLEEKVHRRTGELEAANRRLSGEIAEKEDFLRAVSHDLNAPLRNISGMAAMLLTKHGKSLDADAVHRLDRIQKNVAVETDLLNELLELSRIKSRRGDVARVDTASVVADLAGVFEQDLQSKQIRLTFDADLPAWTAERGRVRQVFQNLIDNAIKYMGDGRPTREIHVGFDRTPGGGGEFYVRDTGIGIEAEDLDKVFHVFRRGRTAAVQAVSGKGVGLASVKSIVETYGGTIRVESVAGTGTTFRFTVGGEHLAADDGPGPLGTIGTGAGVARRAA